MSQLDFAENELDAVAALAAPLQPAVRASFLQRLAIRLSAYPSAARGPGLVYRLAAGVQRDFNVAIGGGGRGGSKYGRDQAFRQGRRR